MDEFIEILKAKKASYSIDGDRICVEGWLDLSHSNITSLPDNLSVGSYLDLSHTNITDLPDNLSVDYLLGISKTNITSLPDNLSVGGWLDLNGTEITSLPDNLSVGCSLYLQPKNIDNIAYREHCGRSNRTIFAAWLNGGIRLSAGCFLNTLSEFEKAVDLKYSGKDAEDYKQAARECVAELTQRWKGTGCSTTWLNVSECLPELDTPVLGCWFSENGNFILGCYVRTYSADAGGWVWAVAEDFGDGHWLFDDDYLVEFWMPLPGKPELAGGAA